MKEHLNLPDPDLYLDLHQIAHHHRYQSKILYILRNRSKCQKQRILEFKESDVLDLPLCLYPHQNIMGSLLALVPSFHQGEICYIVFCKILLTNKPANQQTLTDTGENVTSLEEVITSQAVYLPSSRICVVSLVYVIRTNRKGIILCTHAFVFALVLRLNSACLHCGKM